MFVRFGTIDEGNLSLQPFLRCLLCLFWQSNTAIGFLLVLYTHQGNTINRNQNYLLQLSLLLCNRPICRKIVRPIEYPFVQRHLRTSIPQLKLLKSFSSSIILHFELANIRFFLILIKLLCFLLSKGSVKIKIGIEYDEL